MTPVLKTLLAATLASVALAAPAFAQKNKKPEPARNVITVYLSGHGGSSIAKKMNESHAQMEAQGWRFADMEIHSENADTQGVIVTYVK